VLDAKYEVIHLGDLYFKINATRAKTGAVTRSSPFGTPLYAMSKTAGEYSKNIGRKHAIRAGTDNVVFVGAHNIIAASGPKCKMISAIDNSSAVCRCVSPAA
tara:strand:+ start:13155 stop:13460 length:306 start_codon:yes stop_codon:yes gene_type:complete